MRDAKALRQIPETTVETNLGEKSDSTIHNLPLTILRIQAAPALGRRPILWRVHPSTTPSFRRFAFLFRHLTQRVRSKFVITINH
jgi:hypothetical protein